MDHSVAHNCKYNEIIFTLQPSDSHSEVSDFFDFHLNDLRIPLPLSSLSTDSLRFASLLENKFLKDFLVEKRFFAMAKLQRITAEARELLMVKVYYDARRSRPTCPSSTQPNLALS